MGDTMVIKHSEQPLMTSWEEQQMEKGEMNTDSRNTIYEKLILKRLTLWKRTTQWSVIEDLIYKSSIHETFLRDFLVILRQNLQNY